MLDKCWEKIKSFIIVSLLIFVCAWILSILIMCLVLPLVLSLQFSWCWMWLYCLTIPAFGMFLGLGASE